jgi:hypothetical protein
MSRSEGVSPLENNLRLYDRHRVATRLLFWFPTSLLFYLERVGLGAALRLAAVYFLAVVVLEVPSGWFSDRFGRVHTIRIGAAAWIVAYAAFLIAGSSVVLLSLAQALVALGFAALSGTEAAFHYDTLEALGRPAAFERRESRASRNAFLGTTAAAIVGGVLGLVDLRLPFAAALVAAAYQLVLAARMVEPGAESGRAQSQDPVAPGQIRASVRYLTRPGLAWLFVFMIVQQPLEGLAIDLIQPWLTEATGAGLTDSGAAPLYSGLIVAAISLVGAAAAARSSQLRAAFGLRGALGALASIEALILIGMALTRSPWLVPLLVLRSTQAAAAPVLVAAAAAPLVMKHHRATFLSIGSLAGRLAYGSVLIGLGFFEGLNDVLTVGAGIGVAAVALLLAAHVIFGRDDLDGAIDSN